MPIVLSTSALGFKGGRQCLRQCPCVPEANTVLPNPVLHAEGTSKVQAAKVTAAIVTWQSLPQKAFECYTVP
jgi:hypothetical protein